MPVYGLPSALESSLNSLAHSRPPTSWRVSSHGNDVTVVLRWTQCISPSSDQTVHYNIDHDPKDRMRHSSFSWRQEFSQESDPLTPTGCLLNGRVSKISTKFDSDFQPVKLRSVDTSRRRPLRASPVPMLITSSSAADKPSGNNEHYDVLGQGNLSRYLEPREDIETKDVGGEIKEGSSGCVQFSSGCVQSSSGCVQSSSGCVQSVIPDAPSPSESCHHLEIREGIRTYLSHKSIEASTEEAILDEKSGIIVMSSQVSCGNQSYSVTSNQVLTNTRNRFKYSGSCSQVSPKPNSLTNQLSIELESPDEIIDECLEDVYTMITPARDEGRCWGSSASTIRSQASHNSTFTTCKTKEVIGASSSPASMFMVSEDDLQPCDLEIVCSVESDDGEVGNSSGKHSCSKRDNCVQRHESGDSGSDESSLGAVHCEL